MAQCGIDCWKELMETWGVVDLRYLAINTGSSISISSTYIVFLTEMQKGRIPGKGSTLIKKRYHRF